MRCYWAIALRTRPSRYFSSCHVITVDFNYDGGGVGKGAPRLKKAAPWRR
jgi:hypothetical protein